MSDLSHRKANVTLTLTDRAGKPIAGRPVTVVQQRHKFLFGCNAFHIGTDMEPALQEAYRHRFVEVMNYATLPFYWGGYEKEEGKPDAERLGKMYDWCNQNRLITKGHPLLWHTGQPKWLADKSPAEVERLQYARIERDVAEFAGRIDRWDVVNEAVVAPRWLEGKAAIEQMYKRLGRVGVIKRAFDAARRANPKAILVLNDYDTSVANELLVEECIVAGVGFDVIGIQSHMHTRYLGKEMTLENINRFAKFGRPIHYTEATLISGALKTDSDWMSFHPGWDSTPEGEERQMREAVEFYTTLFEHPAVHGITWWDFADYKAWQGAPAGWLDKQMQPKPVYKALYDLIKRQWWTAQQRLTTDGAGRATFSGFLGDYAVECGATRASVTVDSPGACSVAVVV